MKEIEIVQLVEGRRVSERLPVLEIGAGRYRLQGSPALLAGLASGDEIERENEEFWLLKRGGNVCAQIVTRRCDDAVRAHASRLLKAIGGWLDGKMELDGKCVLVCTLPVMASFPVIERTLDEIARNCRAHGWMYGNVYDEDGEPLNWWPA